jgi:hypothetical protein
VSAFAVHRRVEATPSAPAPTSAAVEPQLCQRYPHIPLLCHMEPKAAERWIARAEGREDQYLEREARRQEAALRDGVPPTPAPAANPIHHAGHIHAHTSAHVDEARS